MHGYEIIQELGQRTEGIWQPSPGSVYPALQLLEDEDLIVAESEGSGGKKQFSLTDAGRAEAESRKGPAPWDHITKGFDPAVGQLREAVGQAFLAVKQVASAGTDDQKARAVTILTETRRKLYAILAEEPPADDIPADS
jgi:DNA-binding PadR family transcriptional regulator